MVKPKRKRISPDQFHALIELFQRTNTPSFELREQVASQLNMTNREVQVWFQNRRAKVNRIRLQQQKNQEFQGQQEQQPQPSPQPLSFTEQEDGKQKRPSYPPLTPLPPPPPALASSPSPPPPPPPSQQQQQQAAYEPQKHKTTSPAISYQHAMHDKYQLPYKNASLDTFHANAIDILATAAEYMRQWDEQERQRQNEEPKRWRPWV